MTYLIIEDEPSSRLFLQSVMAQYHKSWKLLGVCSAVSEGTEAIKTLNPDLVIMDIEIGEGTAFDILNSLEEFSFKIIFISAYEHYALKAIKYAALDYIMKPIDLEELDRALKKIQIENHSEDLRITEFKKYIGQDIEPKTMMLPSGKGYIVVQLDEIAFIEASGQYVYVNLMEGRKIIASHSLGYYEELLSQDNFYRVHKSFIVNISKVARIITQSSPKIELINDRIIDLAHRRKEAFLQLLKHKNIN